VGPRGGARDDDDPLAPERIVSREHYLMWRPRPTGPYARAGRFFPVYGLRVPDHTAYIRRRLGFHTLEEPYGVAGGVVKESWEVHASLFVPAPIWHAGPADRGAAVYYERRLGEAVAVGGQSKLTQNGEEVRWLGGGIGKLWLPGTRLLLMGEVDGGIDRVKGVATVGQLALYGSVTWFAHRGVLVGAALERYHADLALEADARDSLQMMVQFFPRAHFELDLISKLEAQGNRFGSPNGYHMLMLHYWL